MRTCAIEGCDRPYRAKGYCASHYNSILKPDRHRTVNKCEECGAEYVTTRTNGRFCSLDCRDAQGRRDKAERERQAKLPALHPDPSAPLPIRSPKVAKVDTRPRFTTGRCEWCGEWFTTDRFQFENGTATHCSATCTKAGAKYRRRTRKRGAYVAHVRRVDVFTRDGWRCQICHRKVSRTAKVPSPRAATLDHIIPLALGGTHEPVNCQTACYRCNCIKGHRGVGDQLRLIA